MFNIATLPEKTLETLSRAALPLLFTTVKSTHPLLLALATRLSGKPSMLLTSGSYAVPIDPSIAQAFTASQAFIEGFTASISSELLPKETFIFFTRISYKAPLELESLSLELLASLSLTADTWGAPTLQDACQSELLKRIPTLSYEELLELTPLPLTPALTAQITQGLCIHLINKAPPPDSRLPAPYHTVIKKLLSIRDHLTRESQTELKKMNIPAFLELLTSLPLHLQAVCSSYPAKSMAFLKDSIDNLAPLTASRFEYFLTNHSRILALTTDRVLQLQFMQLPEDNFTFIFTPGYSYSSPSFIPNEPNPWLTRLLAQHTLNVEDLLIKSVAELKAAIKEAFPTSTP